MKFAGPTNTAFFGVISGKAVSELSPLPSPRMRGEGGRRPDEGQLVGKQFRCGYKTY